MLKHDYNDKISHNSSDMRLAHLEEMTIETVPELALVADKLYPIPLKQHKFEKRNRKTIRSRTY